MRHVYFGRSPHLDSYYTDDFNHWIMIKSFFTRTREFLFKSIDLDRFVKYGRQDPESTRISCPDAIRRSRSHLENHICTNPFRFRTSSDNQCQSPDESASFKIDDHIEIPLFAFRVQMIRRLSFTTDLDKIRSRGNMKTFLKDPPCQRICAKTCVITWGSLFTDVEG